MQWSEQLGWLVMGSILTLVWEPYVKAWWMKRKLPYSWSCTECKGGTKFTCRANDVRGVDTMALRHKQEMHDHDG